jgi:hypothetical protein
MSDSDTDTAELGWLVAWGRLIYFLRLHVSQAREILLRTARPSPTGLSASKLVAMRTQAHGKRRLRAGFRTEGCLARKSVGIIMLQ